MSAETAMKLIAVTNPFGVFPSFVLPIFALDGELFLQDGRIDGEIEGFSRWRVDTLIDLNPLWLPGSSTFKFIPMFDESEPYFGTPKFHRSAVINYGHSRSWYAYRGEPMRFALATARRSTFFGTREELTRKIDRLLQKENLNPFLKIDIATLYGNDDLYRKAIFQATDLIMSINAQIGRDWERIMLQARDFSKVATG